MSEIPETWRVHLRASGRLKLRATALRAEGLPETVFEACVLLQEVARMELRAIEALPSPAPETRLAAAIEACWCQLEAQDPLGASFGWARVLSEQAYVQPATAAAMLARLSPRFTALRTEFARAIQSAPALQSMIESRRVISAPPTGRPRARRDVEQLLARFPGCPQLWWLAYRLAEADEDAEAAWHALSNARRLDPENRRFAAMELIAAARALPRREVDRRLAAARPTLERAGADVCLTYALAEVALARGTVDRAKRLERALEAAGRGLVQVSEERTRAHLKAVQLAILEMAAGRKPALWILYVAGLPDLAATAAPAASPVDLVAADLRETATFRKVA